MGLYIKMRECLASCTFASLQGNVLTKSLTFSSLCLKTPVTVLLSHVIFPVSIKQKVPGWPAEIEQI